MDAIIDCPPAGCKIAVTVTGPGSAGTICACGRTTDGEKGPAAPAPPAGFFVRVVVFACNTGAGGNTCPPAPADPTTLSTDPTQPNAATDAQILNGKWCASPVQVPSSSTGGDHQIIFGWVMQSVSGTISTVSGPQSQEFYACPKGTAGTTDCCAIAPCGGSSGGGSGGGNAIAAELTTGASLHVTVPDGINAGLHTAGPTAQLKWALHLGKARYDVYFCQTSGLVIGCGDQRTPAATIETRPFSATFPGALFGAESEVVVTVA